MDATYIHASYSSKLQDINQDIIKIAIEKGLLTVVYDKSISAEHVLNWFIMMNKTYRIKKVSMDLYRSTILSINYSRI